MGRDRGSTGNGMRFQGKITSWKDDQGFGFITPNGGGPQVFVHIKSLSSQRRRPLGNEIVTYELTMNGKGQPRAENVAFVRDGALKGRSQRKGAGSLWFAAAFLAFVAGSALAGKMLPVVFGLYLGASAVTFVVYAFDKSAAKSNRQRTSERTLHLFSLAGGWPGALFAQRLLRHKSSKESFQMRFWFTVVLNCGIFGWLLTPFGSRALRMVLGLP
ncbi:MAG: Cold-shock DNA-binding domain [Herminiimonas sp.]|nr:Cold-shock DNA-binding domain [Herminiimonas sp.]